MQKKAEQYSGGKEGNGKEKYVLRLFITGATPNSIRALTNIRVICEAHLQGRFSLEVIDVYRQQEMAEKEQLIALPMLIKKFPLPEKRLVGDLSDTMKVLQILGLNDVL